VAHYNREVTVYSGRGVREINRFQATLTSFALFTAHLIPLYP
jgi:hypothetical protein